jgi:hypothetical protein
VASETVVAWHLTAGSYIATLVSVGNVKGSHTVLAETAKEAQEINLSLEDR